MVIIVSIQLLFDGVPKALLELDVFDKNAWAFCPSEVFAFCHPYLQSTHVCADIFRVGICFIRVQIYFDAYFLDAHILEGIVDSLHAASEKWGEAHQVIGGAGAFLKDRTKTFDTILAKGDGVKVRIQGSCCRLVLQRFVPQVIAAYAGDWPASV